MSTENIPAYQNDAVDLTEIFRGLFRQRGLVIATILLCILSALAFQLSKVAFYAPKSVDYPIALEFVTSDSNTYPNGAAFSRDDLIVPTVIRAALEKIQLKANVGEVAEALSVSGSNALIRAGEVALLDKLKDKKLAEDVLAETRTALTNLKRSAASYVTISLNLEKIKLSEKDASAFLTALVSEWAEETKEKGLINPDIPYPNAIFVVNPSTNLVDNYDNLSDYTRSLQASVETLSKYSGSDTLSTDGKSLKDISIDLAAIYDNDIAVMRTYSYSTISLTASDDPLTEIQIVAQKRVKELQKQEIAKRIRVYDELLERLNNQQLPQQQIGFDGVTVNSGGGGGTQLETGVLNELMELGSRVSSTDLKKDIINKRIAASEELFTIEREIAIISGENFEKGVSGNRAEIIKMMPLVLENAVNKVNKNQQLFSRLVKAFAVMRLSKSANLYSAIDVPYVSNKFGFQLKKTVMILAIAGFMGFAIGCVLALFRVALLSRKEQERQA